MEKNVWTRDYYMFARLNCYFIQLILGIYFFIVSFITCVYDCISVVLNHFNAFLYLVLFSTLFCKVTGIILADQVYYLIHILNIGIQQTRLYSLLHDVSYQYSFHAHTQYKDVFFQLRDGLINRSQTFYRKTTHLISPVRLKRIILAQQSYIQHMASMQNTTLMVLAINTYFSYKIVQ